MAEVDLTRSAVALKALRERAGMSQAQLAASSGVSVRSIRGIERGSVKAPHPATLLALSEALGLTSSQADTFLRSWQETVRFRTYQEVMSSDVHEGLLRAVQEASFRSTLDKRTVSVGYEVAVGENRCINDIRYNFVVEARRDGVDSHLFVCQRDVGDAELTTVEDTVGCAVRSRTVDHATNLVVVDLSLGRTLREGELTSFGFRQVNGWPADQAFMVGEAADTNFTSRPRWPIDVLSIRIAFAAGVEPSAAWQLEGVDHAERVASLEVDQFRTVGRVWQDAVGGLHGIEWAWGRTDS